MKKNLFAILLLMGCLVGCSVVTPPETTENKGLETTVPNTQMTEPAGTTVPEETEPNYAEAFAWYEEVAKRNLYGVEDYYAFERYFVVEGDPVFSHLSAQDGQNFFPVAKDGGLFLQNGDGSVCFRVGAEAYENLTVLGTDSWFWIYCVEDGKTLFRVDPSGNSQVLYRDENGKIGTSVEWEGNFYLSDGNNLAFFTAAAPEGYGLYRVHLPSGQVDLLDTCQEPIRIVLPRSNFQVTWTCGDGSQQFTTPGKTWNLEDPLVKKFQKLLEAGKDSVMDGINNWYNDAASVLHDSPETVSLNSLMDNGFADLPTRLTQKELEALGEKADPQQHYRKLPGARVDALLQRLYGLTRAELAQNTLAENNTVLYDALSDTYYKPCRMDSEGQIYVWTNHVTVHKVEEKADGTVWVWYLAEYPTPFGSDVGDEENLMVLTRNGEDYQILSNTRAVQPL